MPVRGGDMCTNISGFTCAVIISWEDEMSKCSP